MQRFAFVWSRLRQIWRDDPWLRFPAAVYKRLRRQLRYRLYATSLGRLQIYFYHAGRRLGLPVPRRPAAAATFHWTTEGAISLARRLQASEPEYVRSVITWADEVRAHRIRLLGQTLSFGQRLEWSADPASGKVWPLRYFNDLLPAFHMGDGSDIKIPYELSRFHHGVALGLAYRLTGDTAYAAEFVAQLKDWWRCNPCGFGVNWTCTMDVGIRAANLLWAHHLCAGAPALDAAYQATFRRCMYEHGNFIIRNPENRAGFNSNHYMANLAGLFYIGVLCPDLPSAARWVDWAQAELEREMQQQVYPDGVNFEASTSYHRLTLEFFLYPALLARRNGQPFSPAYMERLRLMLEFSHSLLKPDGRIPQIGDNDSGRFFSLAPRHPLEQTYLVDMACLLFGDPRFKPWRRLDPEAVWAFGPEAWSAWEVVAAGAKPGSRGFPDGGIYILRHDSAVLYVACSPNGQAGNGGHAHNDKLSFELVWDDRDVIVDPGTYVYTRFPDWRNRFRSTAWHNTLKLADAEQNRFRPEGLFTLMPDAQAVCTAWDPDGGRFAGYHTGYERLGWRHCRELILGEGGDLCCRDWLEQRPTARQLSPDPVGHLHLAPGIDAVVQDTRTIALLRGDTHIGTVRFGADVQATVEEAWYSPGYGEKEPCQAINFRWLGLELAWKICREAGRPA